MAYYPPHSSPAYPKPRDEWDDQYDADQDPLGVTTFLIGGGANEVRGAPPSAAQTQGGSVWQQRRPRLEAQPPAASVPTYYSQPAYRQAVIEVEEEDPRAVLPLCRFHLTGRAGTGSSAGSLTVMSALTVIALSSTLSCLNNATSTWRSAARGQPTPGGAEGEEGGAEEMKCGICLELVKNSGQPYGLLNGCDHVFCLVCIRNWRESAKMEEEKLEAARSCPLCRNHSDYVVPSWVFPSSAEEKEMIIAGYKRNCARIPCKHFNFGQGECPFGSSCFYDHRYRDGRPASPPDLRLAAREDGRLEVMKAVTLSDFLPIKGR
eukprot:CAMPEP_0113875106 /NCGR_PEP_ID=MMETSP0780_2-20120614/4748_1 /TAXON_ID=652834 /ORGANISM="Palpitomonas bilix" /LENGTH=319 /DNA_ID=CAMNT_0000861039 /DNA_START=96 /DNA_END=1056 /DNA_ORIENTATION=+ /assembly_acc=CAM_ASM_000599